MTTPRTNAHFNRMSAGAYHTDNYALWIEKVGNAWVVSEQGKWRAERATLNEAKAWARRFMNGETYVGRA